MIQAWVFGGTVRRLFQFVGWLVITVGILFSLIACWALGSSLLIPDTSGSPDARGMLLGASLFSLLIIGSPITALGAMVVAFAKARAPKE